jgi:hypothetical protein
MLGDAERVSLSLIAASPGTAGFNPIVPGLAEGGGPDRRQALRGADAQCHP